MTVVLATVSIVFDSAWIASSAGEPLATVRLAGHDEADDVVTVGLRLFDEQDGDRDGLVTRTEASPRFWRVFEEVDANNDQVFSRAEFSNALKTGAPAIPRNALSTRGQQSDPLYFPSLPNPAFARASGPLVLLDEAHANFHTAEGRFAPFVDLLQTDGYVVRPLREPFSRQALKDCRVLVISNALAKQNVNEWKLPTPSAFTSDEISAVRAWVDEGGSLLLIADHMPFAGAAEDLGEAFGFHFTNGFAFEVPRRTGPMIFRRAEKRLHDHPIAGGRDESEAIGFVATFTGSAFSIDDQCTPLLSFSDTAESLNPEVAWQFTDDTPRVPLKGWHQAATRQFGKGRVAVFGEAAMFTAQRSGNRVMGMNSPEAPHNQQFVLNVLHWLSGLLASKSPSLSER